MRFTFKGCKFYIGVPFLAFITSVLILDSSGNVTWCLIAMLVHEVGHIICMLSQRKGLRKVEFCLLDIKIVDEFSTLRSYKEDLILMASGPIANFAVAILFYIVNLILELRTLEIFVYENLALGVFNLLPIESLDGGQFLFCLLKMRFNEHVSQKILNAVSILTLFPIQIAGFFLLLNSKYNFSLLLLGFYLLFRIVLKDDVKSRWNFQ